MSASEFIKSFKLKLASKMLMESGESISEIAYRTGFSTPSYFTKCFKEQYKMSPSQYLQNQRK
jgi:AraC-like DNA-binding protein